MRQLQEAPHKLEDKHVLCTSTPDLSPAGPRWGRGDRGKVSRGQGGWSFHHSLERIAQNLNTQATFCPSLGLPHCSQTHPLALTLPRPWRTQLRALSWQGSACSPLGLSVLQASQGQGPTHCQEARGSLEQLIGIHSPWEPFVTLIQKPFLAFPATSRAHSPLRVPAGSPLWITRSRALGVLSPSWCSPLQNHPVSWWTHGKLVPQAWGQAHPRIHLPKRQRSFHFLRS